MNEYKAFRFTDDQQKFRVVIFAKTLKNAREYVSSNAISSLSYRRLKYVGEGEPTNKNKWLAVNAERRKHFYKS